MADYILGAILVWAMYFALRHIYRNLVSGKCDCLGDECSGCSGCNGGNCSCGKTVKRA